MSPESDLLYRLMAAGVMPDVARNLHAKFRATSLTPLEFLLNHSASLTAVQAQAARKADPSRIAASGVQLLRYDEYPRRLSGRTDLPTALVIRGESEVLARPAVAIVGTRRASAYGKSVARRFAEAISRAGAAVISGGATGVDTAAHLGALDAGGVTVAVFGGGIDRTFPANNGPLFERIATSGCLISQFPMGGGLRAGDFVARNNTIVHLSDAVVIVEAGPKSGALHTARFAQNAGCPLFAVPANIDNRNFAGSHEWLRTGQARFADHPDVVLEALGIAPLSAPSPNQPLTPIQRKILAALRVEPMDAERLAEAVDLDPGTVSIELTMLEIDALIRSDGPVYVLAR